MLAPKNLGHFIMQIRTKIDLIIFANLAQSVN